MTFASIGASILGIILTPVKLVVFLSSLTDYKFL